MTVLTPAEVEDLKLVIVDAPTMEGFKVSDWGTWGYQDEGATAINNIWNMVDTYEAAYTDLLDVSADLVTANATIASQASTITSQTATIAARDATIASLNATITAKDATIASKDVIIAEKDVEISSLETDNATLTASNATLTADNALLTAEVAKLELIAYGDPRVQPQYQARRPVTALNDTRTNRADGSQFWGPLET